MNLMVQIFFRSDTGQPGKQQRSDRDRRDGHPRHCGPRRSRLHRLRHRQDVQDRIGIEAEEHSGLQRRRRPAESAAKHDGVQVTVLRRFVK